MSGRRLWSVAVSLVLWAATAAPGVEPWADRRLTVTDGLALWLDATRLHVSANDPQGPNLRDGDPVRRWPDASGRRREARQEQPSRQPVLERLAAAGQPAPPAVRFDGQDDVLSADELGGELAEGTLIVVGAPLSNRGGFRGLAAMNAAGKNDYVTGMTLDLGPGATPALGVVNLEGRGFGGAVNLLSANPQPFGGLHVFTATLGAGAGAARLFLDGQQVGSRDRSSGSLSLEQFHVGGRFYSNTADPAATTGYFDGSIAEILLYERVLGDAERLRVEQYLREKYDPLGRALAARMASQPGKPLVSVPRPPLVQMFLPGFSARALPLDLPNINNLRYREDGKLVALAYDGSIYLLSDSDGDGLEDRAQTFWERGSLRAPIGMALTPPGYARGRGVLVASKGKLSLIVDTDGDDRADRETVVAQGWQELPHGVDALGVAIDRDGSLYFGLGATDFTNAYQVDLQGRGHFDLHSQRGTILKVAPDFSRREVVATGVRFSVGLAFNAAGDLFATDQEGATWLPNGNPLDELLHIQPGRHYGFPPRHPRHLPNVIDEPSTVEYGPQHQSTCGLTFNEPVAGGKVFGPAAWRGDALVSGYTRGKLYRTTLAKTPAGYVGQNRLLANLGMCTADACVAPSGALLVACHSGGPDWGTGPSGRGKLLQIVHRQTDLPLPVAAWAAGPAEVAVAFDRPLEPADEAALARRVAIEYGRYLRAGDRFETLRPGYQVVQDQLGSPRHELAVRAARLSADRRTLVLQTERQTEALWHAVTLKDWKPPAPSTGELPQSADVDLDYTLSGVQAQWQSADGALSWSGWLPHFDLQVCQALTAGSAEHERLWALLEKPGTLKLRARLNLSNMLRPEVQPGATIDYSWPPETVTLAWSASGPLRVSGPKGPAEAGGGPAKLVIPPSGDALAPIDVELQSGDGPLELRVAWSTQEDARQRPLPLHRILLPWARLPAPEVPATRPIPAELAGADWQRGHKVFLSDEAQCAKCHRVGNEGGAIGPNLSNLRQRDYASVLRDIEQPSHAINPDFIAYTAVLEDGRVLAGTVRSDGEQLRIGDSRGTETVVARSDVEQLSPQSVSIMPEGLPKLLGPARTKDLLAFLLLSPPEELSPAPLTRSDAPPARSRAEVEAALKGAEPIDAAKLRTLRIALVAGDKDHGPDEHDYPAWQRRWSRLLARAEKVEVSTSMGWPTADELRAADVLVWYSANPLWSPERAREFDEFFARGGGMVFLHYAVNAPRGADELAQRIGLAWVGGQSKFRHGPLDLKFSDAAKHPIIRNFSQVHFVDETYWQLAGDLRRVQVLATAVEEGAAQPLLWTHEPGKGRVFGSILGHYSWTFDDPLFRVLVLRGIAWAGRENVDRLNALVPIGARWAEP